MRAFVVLGLVPFTPSREICLGKRLRNDLICKTTTQSIKSRRSICDRCRLLRGRLVIPESPRWLAVNRRYEEVTELLGKICSINGLKLPDDFNPADLADMVRSRSSLQYLLQWRSQGGGGRGHAPPPRNWVHKKIPGCAVELNTQNCAWFGSQISFITAMSFPKAMPPEPPTRGSAPGWGTSVPRPPVPPPPNPGCATDVL